jgi:hypothetical protein
LGWAELKTKAPQVPANMIEALTLALEQAKTIEASREKATARRWLPGGD